MSLDLETRGGYLAKIQHVDWTIPVITRGGSAIRLYDAEGGGLKPVMGAYYNNEEWIPCSWDLNGHFRIDGKQCSLDVVNGDNEEEKNRIA